MMVDSLSTIIRRISFSSRVEKPRFQLFDALARDDKRGMTTNSKSCGRRRLLATLGVWALVVVQSTAQSERTVRELPCVLQNSIADRLLPDDDIVIITRNFDDGILRPVYTPLQITNGHVQYPWTDPAESDPQVSRALEGLTVDELSQQVRRMRKLPNH